jgi:F-box-like
VEVLDEIFSYARNATLARLALVCSTFQGVATRLLYRHIPPLSLALTTRCLETLASNSSLAAHTRTCEIGDAAFADASRKGLLPRSFFEHLKRALHNMYRLTELTFLLNGPISHVLVGAPFRLTKVTASCEFDATFASWLTEQPGLRSAIFCGNFTPGVTLPADALPLLRRVAAAPLALACVVPGRPIRDIELCLVHPWSLNREVLQTTIRIVSFSKGPLDSLKVISHLSEPPETVLSALEAIPTGLNSITKFALHAVSGSITEVRIPLPTPQIMLLTLDAHIQDILSGLPPILAQFSGLKTLNLFSKNRSDALHTAADPRTLVASWHATCTSLESVTLVGATYVHNKCLGWVTLRDLADLLTAREQSLQHRAAEICKREAALEEGSRRVHSLTPEHGVEREGSASFVAITA